MPIYHFVCRNPQCELAGKIGRKLLTRDEVDGWVANNPCECGARLSRAGAGLTTQGVTRIDNGRMGRPVEIRDNIKDLVEDHRKRG